MRATEKTYYDVKRLHVWMAVASLALLAVTVWMVAADHQREWKRYQRTYRDEIQPWLTAAQIELQRSDEFLAREKELIAALDKARQSVPDRSAVEQLREDANAAALRHDEAQRRLRLRRAEFDEARSYYESGVGEGLAVEKLDALQAEVDRLSADVEQLTKQANAAAAQQQALRENLGQVTAEEDAAREALAAHRRTLDRLDRTLARQRPSLGKRLLRLPLIDAWGRPLAIDQIWLPQLEIDYNFRTVARFDRCVTCHQGIDQSGLAALISHGAVEQPHCPHPRLDLFVGALSPHPKAEFGCTICHDGQGGATEFAGASHTPNDPAQRKARRDEHDWHANPHWDLPMMAGRFTESRCLRCHHAVTDLGPSPRFPEESAPKLLAGYNLVRQYGCFGCHEIKGYNDAGRRVGPDMRLEPGDVAAADQLHPGTMRKVGPSLRDVASRLDARFLVDWIARPTQFRTSTRMPQQFGQHDHLKGRSLAEGQRFEPIEIRGIAEYLLSASEPVEPLPAPESVTEEPSAERGRKRFEIHGCLACHRHVDFPKAQSAQGPDLSNLGDKYTTAAGRSWLTDWIRDPHRHAPRTLMPNALLEPEPLADEEDRITDPAADVAAYLIGEAREQAPAELRSIDPSDLDETLRDVGARAIGRLGCYGCHDISGFEDATPIGPALSDWGRKQESLLAFEQVHRYVGDAPEKRLAAADTPEERLAVAGTAAFFREALLVHRREGFLWQKLREPRSFDYQKAHNKPYDQWLAMGHFELSDEQIEAIATFVLGLVADPPAEKFIYQPNRRRKAIIEGRQVLDKYACAECHTLEMERWAFEFDPDEFFGPALLDDFDFLKPHVSPAEIAASLVVDELGLGHGEIVGMPQVDADGALAIADDDVDDGDNEIFLYSFTPWQSGALGGEPYAMGGPDVLVWSNQITAKRPPQGGAFARMLYPTALADARAIGANPTGPEAWGWAPPPLVDEGAKVRPAWLHDYLLDPAVIRPAAVLRMPRYNLSPDEAAKLVDYFAAAAGVEFPYASPPQGRLAELEARERQRPGRLDDAMKVLADKQTFCAKCHQLGDYSPGEAIRTTLAPDLGQVGRRLRPEYVRRWLANPRSAPPYTGMPVNFPPAGPPLGQDLFPGGSLEQLDAVTDLLLHFDRYLQRRTPLTQLAPAAEEPDGAASQGRSE